uniref:Uncharacterized protein n=1 Tax=Rhizophagus irregularis (strain DAOM 181602 / DAOM 197198 / MUCL 43194) TaxID=747089 RepID=U9T093_RHIID
MDFNYSYSTFFENKIEENKITRDTFENQGDTQREELQHRTSGTTYVSSEIQRNIQSDDLEEEIQQCKISLDSIIQKGPVLHSETCITNIFHKNISVLVTKITFLIQK